MNILSFFQNIFAPPRDLILIILAAWIGLTLSERRASRHHVNLDSLSNLLLVSTVSFIVGGRLIYVLENLSIFMQSAASIFSLNIALFDQWGALLIAFITAFVYGRRVHLPLWHSLDALTPLFATVAIGIGFSHLASGAAFGKETAVPWAIDQWGALRHPTQIYEIIASILILVLILIQKTTAQPGYEFMLFVAFTAASQLVIEGFRGDSTLILGSFRLEQIAAWLILLAVLIGLDHQKRLNQEK
jgi:phosphatidylglycerol:prolipoprotein diacylglycerol transferase